MIQLLFPRIPSDLPIDFLRLATAYLLCGIESLLLFKRLISFLNSKNAALECTAPDPLIA